MWVRERERKDGILWLLIIVRTFVSGEECLILSLCVFGDLVLVVS